MQTLFEKHVAENYAIAAFVLFECCRQFQETKGESSGLSFEQALLVPPLVFHRRTATAFAKTLRTNGLFYRVVTENVFIPVGLQARLEDSYQRTLNAIHLGASANMLHIKRGPEFCLCASVIDRRGSILGNKAPKDIKLLLQAANRIGYCLATTEFPIVCAALRIDF